MFWTIYHENEKLLLKKQKSKKMKKKMKKKIRNYNRIFDKCKRYFSQWKQINFLFMKNARWIKSIVFRNRIVD